MTVCTQNRLTVGKKVADKVKASRLYLWDYFVAVASLVSFRAGQAIAAGDVVTINSSGLLFKASSTSEQTARVVGLALNSGVAQDLVLVNKDNYFTNSSGLTPGEFVYLSVTSGLINPSYATWLSGVKNLGLLSAYMTNLGQAVTTSGFAIEINKPFFVNTSGI